jgi:hypothetical protein
MTFSAVLSIIDSLALLVLAITSIKVFSEDYIHAALPMKIAIACVIFGAIATSADRLAGLNPVAVWNVHTFIWRVMLDCGMAALGLWRAVHTRQHIGIHESHLIKRGH